MKTRSDQELARTRVRRGPGLQPNGRRGNSLWNQLFGGGTREHESSTHVVNCLERHSGGFPGAGTSLRRMEGRQLEGLWTGCVVGSRRPLVDAGRLISSGPFGVLRRVKWYPSPDPPPPESDALFLDGADGGHPSKREGPKTAQKTPKTAPGGLQTLVKMK